MCSIQTIAMPRAFNSRMMSTSSFASASVSPPPISSKQQHGRVGRERARKLKALAIDESEGLRASVGDSRHAGQRKRFDCRLHRRDHARAPPPCAAAVNTFSNTVMPLNGLGIWCVRASPRRHRSAVGAMGDVVAEKAHASGGRRMRADQEAEQGRLSGAVRTDDADRFAGDEPKSRRRSSTRRAPKLFVRPSASSRRPSVRTPDIPGAAPRQLLYGLSFASMGTLGSVAFSVTG